MVKNKVTIVREFRRITKIEKSGTFIELDNFSLINKKNIIVDVGDELRVGDVITIYVIDDNKSFLSVIHKKEFNPNVYPEIAEEKIRWFKEE